MKHLGVILLFTLAGGCGLANRRPTTGPYSNVDPSTGIGVTTVDIKTYPPGVPADAVFTFFGRPGHTFAVEQKPISESGTLYMYDDTDGKMATVQHLSPQHPGFHGDPDPRHEYRGFFLPDRLRDRPATRPAGP